MDKVLYRTTLMGRELGSREEWATSSNPVRQCGAAHEGHVKIGAHLKKGPINICMWRERWPEYNCHINKRKPAEQSGL